MSAPYEQPAAEIAFWMIPVGVISGLIAASIGRPLTVRTSTPPAENSRCTSAFYQTRAAWHLRGASADARMPSALGERECRGLSSSKAGGFA